jgi:hypothetical protein
MKKNTYTYWALLSAILMSFFSILNFTSCNNSPKKNETTVAQTNENEKEGREKEQKIKSISKFYSYRLTRDEVIQPGFTKLLVCVSFDDLADPTKMSLYCYPGTLGPPPSIGSVVPAKEETEITFNPGPVVISTNEISYTNFRNGAGNIKFDYIILTPEVFNGYLSYDVKAYYNSAEVALANLPLGERRAKPSPPAAPQPFKFTQQ